MKRLSLAFFLTLAALSAQENPQKAEAGDDNMTWKVANFAILAAGLGYLLVKSLPPFFKSRTGEIQKGITEAQLAKQQAEKRAAEMDARLSALGTEIEKFRVAAQGEMEQEGARIRLETAKQIERLQLQAKQEIETAGKVATRELQKYAAKLALDLAEQRIRTRLDGPTEAGLVEDFVRDLGASKN